MLARGRLTNGTRLSYNLPLLMLKSLPPSALSLPFSLHAPCLPDKFLSDFCHFLSFMLPAFLPDSCQMSANYCPFMHRPIAAQCTCPYPCLLVTLATYVALPFSSLATAPAPAPALAPAPSYLCSCSCSCSCFCFFFFLSLLPTFPDSIYPSLASTHSCPGLLLTYPDR